MTADNELNMPPKPKPGIFQLNTFRINLKSNTLIVEGETIQDDGKFVIVKIGDRSDLVVPSKEITGISRVHLPPDGAAR